MPCRPESRGAGKRLLRISGGKGQCSCCWFFGPRWCASANWQVVDMLQQQQATCHSGSVARISSPDPFISSSTRRFLRDKRVVALITGASRVYWNGSARRRVRDNELPSSSLRSPRMLLQHAASARPCAQRAGRCGSTRANSVAAMPWDQRNRFAPQIKECVLFVPVISETQCARRVTFAWREARGGSFCI